MLRKTPQGVVPALHHDLAAAAVFRQRLTVCNDFDCALWDSGELLNPWR